MEQMSISTDGTTFAEPRARHLVPAPAAAHDEGSGGDSGRRLADPGEVVGTSLTTELDEVLVGLRRRGPTAALRSDLAELLGAWSASLTRLHRRPVDGRMPLAPLPWVLVDDPLPAWLTTLPAVAGRAWAVRAHPSARRAVDEARRGWRASQWVHGAAGDDVVIRWDADHRISATQVLPGATTGLGDARWDVASALDWIAVALGPALDPDWQIDPVADFLAAYRALGGQAEPTRALTVARTIATAVEWSAELAGSRASANDEDHAWLAALWARPLDLVSGGAHRP